MNASPAASVEAVEPALIDYESRMFQDDIVKGYGVALKEIGDASNRNFPIDKQEDFPTSPNRNLRKSTPY